MTNSLTEKSRYGVPRPLHPDTQTRGYAHGESQH